ncbi:MAG: TolC family protein [Acidobacteriota bacterium]
MTERHRRVSYARTLALLASWAGLAGAAELQVSTTPQPPIDSAAEVRVENNSILLTIDEAVTLALQRNLGIAVQRYSRETSRLGVQFNRGIYDLNLTANGTYSDAKVQTQEGSFQPPSLKATQLDLGLAQLIPTGGTFTLGWQNSKSESGRPRDLPSGVGFQGTFFQTSPAVRFTQPLLRNFGKLATDRNIQVAQANSDISRQSFELQVTSIVQQVENAYWDLRGAREQLRVANEALGLAKELHQMNRVRVDVGTAAPLELVQSEVGIATSEENIISAQAAVGDAGDRLRRLLNFQQGAAWDQEIVPETSPETEHPTVDVPTAISTAMATRPELVTQKLTVKINEINNAYYHNQWLPRLDASVGYGLKSGVAKSGDLFNSLSDFPSWNLGLAFAFPIQNRAARAQSTIAGLNLDQAKTSERDLEVQVVTEVRTAARQVDTAAKQIDSAKVSSTLAERNLDAERKKYENGMSTSFQVTQIQQDLTSARSREVNAVTGYRKALVEYYRAIGKLLAQSGVAIADAAPATAPAPAPAQ